MQTSPNLYRTSRDWFRDNVTIKSEEPRAQAPTSVGYGMKPIALPFVSDSIDQNWMEGLRPRVDSGIHDDASDPIIHQSHRFATVCRHISKVEL